MVAIEIEELNSTNCKTYLLTCGAEAALVDPVRERLVLYQQILAARQLRLRMVVETHTHADHLSLGRATHDILGVPLVCHEASPSPLVDLHLVDGERIALGDAAITVWHTPGHTPDSICLLVDGAVLTGDMRLRARVRFKADYR